MKSFLIGVALTIAWIVFCLIFIVGLSRFIDFAKVVQP